MQLLMPRVSFQVLSVLTQPTRSCVFQTETHIRAFQAALKQAGFIGGRRGVAEINGSSGLKRKPVRKTGGRKPKRSRPDGQAGEVSDMDERADPATVSPTLTTANLPCASDIDLSKRGPDEILPDRALTKAERLQIVNHAPRSLVDLHVLVEELTMRFTEAQVYELLEIVHTHLPLAATDDEVEQQAQQAQQMGMQGEETGLGNETYTDGIQGDETADGEHNGLFMGGAEDQEAQDAFVASVDDEAEDAWANEAGGGGNDDLAGDGVNDDDET